jgi:cytochrome c oxidase cbb3-type subunit 3
MFTTIAQATFWSDPFNSPMLPLYVTISFLIITIILLVLVIVYVMKVLNYLTRQVEIERAAKLGIPVKARQTWWVKFWEQANGSVPLEQEENIDTGHEYDGIRELDNHLPPWWKGLFYATIVWGLIYLVVYHVSDSLPLSIGEYQQELAKADENARILKASRPAEVIDENTLVYTVDADLIAKGKAVFTSNNCASCHRADGGGNSIGPNLTDAYWLHGGSIKNIYSTINAGVVEKGMPAWGKVMSAADVRNVAFYIMSLQGSQPLDSKAPQGQLYAPADTVVAIAN